jgi:hypothetical protein
MQFAYFQKLPFVYTGERPRGEGLAGFRKRDRERMFGLLSDDEQAARKYMKSPIAGVKGVIFMGQINPKYIEKAPKPKQQAVTGAIGRNNQIFLNHLSKSTHGVVWTPLSKPCTPKKVAPAPVIEPKKPKDNHFMPVKYDGPKKPIDY